MRKVSHTRYFAVFILTFAFGFGISRIVINDNKFAESFSLNEAERLLNKNVKSLCNGKNIKTEDTEGKVVYIDDNKGGRFIVIEWEYSLRGRHELIRYDKKEFEKCVFIIDIID